MANEGASATLNKLRNQLGSLGGDMDNLRFRQRIELQIARIPVPEGDELLCVVWPLLVYVYIRTYPSLNPSANPTLKTHTTTTHTTSHSAKLYGSTQAGAAALKAVDVGAMLTEAAELAGAGGGMALLEDEEEREEAEKRRRLAEEEVGGWGCGLLWLYGARDSTLLSFLSFPQPTTGGGGGGNGRAGGGGGGGAGGGRGGAACLPDAEPPAGG